MSYTSQNAINTFLCARVLWSGCYWQWCAGSHTTLTLKASLMEWKQTTNLWQNCSRTSSLWGRCKCLGNWCTYKPTVTWWHFGMKHAFSSLSAWTREKTVNLGRYCTTLRQLQEVTWLLKRINLSTKQCPPPYSWCHSATSGAILLRVCCSLVSKHTNSWFIFCGKLRNGVLLEQCLDYPSN
jgi:hypothetical protein